jgi:6-phosphofructokinase 1
MIDYRTGKVKIRTVDTTTETYEVARKYMIRLEKEDLAGHNLGQIARTSNMTPEDFKARFEYTLGSPCI